MGLKNSIHFSVQDTLSGDELSKGEQEILFFFAKSSKNFNKSLLYLKGFEKLYPEYGANFLYLQE